MIGPAASVASAAGLGWLAAVWGWLCCGVGVGCGLVGWIGCRVAVVGGRVGRPPVEL